MSSLVHAEDIQQRILNDLFVAANKRDTEAAQQWPDYNPVDDTAFKASNVIETLCDDVVRAAGYYPVDSLHDGPYILYGRVVENGATHYLMLTWDEDTDRFDPSEHVLEPAPREWGLATIQHFELKQ